MRRRGPACVDSGRTAPCPASVRERRRQTRRQHGTEPHVCDRSGGYPTLSDGVEERANGPAEELPFLRELETAASRLHMRE